MIATERAHAPVRTLCRLFGVSPSGFYASQSRPESKRVQEDRRLKVLLHASFTGGRGYYGSPRIHDDFIEWGERVSRKRIIRLKQEEGLHARVRKRYKGPSWLIAASNWRNRSGLSSRMRIILRFILSPVSVLSVSSC